MDLENESFDVEKPTVVYFGGGGWDFWGVQVGWKDRANIIGASNYDRPADKLLAFLSAQAPRYYQPIQFMGSSAGGWAATELGAYLNSTYSDVRYAVNRVSVFDTPRSVAIDAFLASRVGNEQCWVDNYVSDMGHIRPNVLNVEFETVDHGLPVNWYKWSLSSLSEFNSGIMAGAYWSVAGPGKNLRPANHDNYRFIWFGDRASGYLDFLDESSYPGRLPEPVTLLVWKDDNEPNCLGLSCKESENVIGYQLLRGPYPYNVSQYDVISDTLYPPNHMITDIPDCDGWWTIRAYDQYGSTIYADPIRLDSLDVNTPVANMTAGKRYQRIGDAIYLASDGDEIVVPPGTYYENINFHGKNVKVRSANPTDPSVVAATVINGWGRGPAVTFESREESSCMLRGFTIEGGAVRDTPPLHDDMGTGGGAIACFDLFRVGPVISDCVVTGNDCAGLYCYRSGPTVINCTFAGNDSNGVELQGRSLAKFINCAIVGNRGCGVFGGYPMVTNCTIVGNELSAIASYAPKVSNCILWDNASGNEQGRQIIDFDGSGSVTYNNVQGGWAGEGNIDSDPCFVGPGSWVPFEAWGPNPPGRRINVAPNTILSWSAGRAAMSHDVYFGTDYDSVNAATTDSNEFMGNQDSNSWGTGNYDPSGLAIRTTYYWRVDEVNDAHADSLWKGHVRSFTTFDSNLVGWWQFDEGAGTLCADSTAYGNDGTIMGLVEWAQGHGDGYSLEFSGGSVVVPDASELRPRYQVTASAWINYHEPYTVHRRVVCKGVNDYETFSLERGHGYDQMNFMIREDETYHQHRVWGFGLERDEWVHIAGTYDGSCMRCYMNGELQDSEYFGPINLSQNTEGLGIGNHSEDFESAFLGIIDDVRVYDRGLSADEIRQAYQQGLTKEQPIGYSGDYRLRPSSPCIDAGDNLAVPFDVPDIDGDGNTAEPIPWDIDCQSRFVDYPQVLGSGNGTPPIVDMGAYEAFLPPIEVWMKFTPQALNPFSKGNWVKAHFVLPEGFVVDDVDADTPVEIEQLGIESHYMNVFVNEDGLVGIEAGFDRTQFCRAVKGGEVMEVTVIGFFTDGRRFSGTDTIRILDKTMERLATLALHWLQPGCGAPDWCGGSDMNRDSVVNLLDFTQLYNCCIEVP
jgi:parallel beta-helix repeat protein